MPRLDISGGQLHYEVHGSCYPVLLFAPGFLSSRIERWSTNPARPGVAQDWLDPIAAGSGFVARATEPDRPVANLPRTKPA